MHSTSGFKVELIDTEDALGQVMGSWRRLAAERGNAFVTPEWYLAAIRTLHRGCVPAVAVVREADGAIRGLLPMLSVRSRRAPRLVSFPGTRYGDLYHPVAAEGDDERIATAAAPVLAGHLGTRCQLDIGRVDAGAGWWRELARAWPAAMTAVPRPARGPSLHRAGRLELGGLPVGAQPAVPQPGGAKDARAAARPSGAPAATGIRAGGAG